MGSGGLTHAQRHLDDASFDELLKPGIGDDVGAGGDDDPVEGCAVSETRTAVGDDHASAVAASLQRSTRGAGDLAVNVDGRHTPAFANELRQQCRVVARAGSDLEHPHPWLKTELLEHLGHDRRLRR
jgi:hypothetical protein